MTSNVRAVLFDLDGTLLDSLPAFLAITRRACRELGWPQPGAGYMREVMTLGRSPIEALLGPVDNAEERRAQLTEVSMRLWKPVFQQEARLFHDALPVLQRLFDQGFRLGVVTDSNHFVVKCLTGARGCPPLEVIVTRDEAPARKPSPTGIELALRHMGVEPHAAAYVGDNPIDIQAASSAGVRAFGITTGASRREDLLPHSPHAVVDSLTELHGHLPAWTQPVRGANPAPAILRGELVSGLGQAGGFLAVDWVRDAIEAMLGGPFYPGTVNLDCGAPGAQIAVRHRHDNRLRRFELPARDGFCPALLHAVQLSHGLSSTPALLLWPQVPGYPDEKLELICRIPLREGWALAEGAMLELRYLNTQEPWP